MLLYNLPPQKAKLTNKVPNDNPAIYKSRDPPLSVPPYEGFTFFIGKNNLNFEIMHGVICKLNKVNLVFLEGNECILQPKYDSGCLRVF